MTRIARFYHLLRLQGLPRILVTTVYRLFMLRQFWERLFVRKINGRALAAVMGGLSSYCCDDLVSVVLPVNNGRSRGIERLIASLKAQTHRNLEIVAVDSGSSDDTVEWLRSQDCRVLEIRPQDFTHAYSRNTGAAAAKGKYLLFTVDDAVFADSDWLRSALYLLNSLEADAISGRQSIDDKARAYAALLDYFLFSAQNDRLGVNISRNSKPATFCRHFVPMRSQFRSVTIDDTNHLVRREAFERIKFHTPTVEDLDFAVRLTLAGGKTIYTNLLSILHYHQYPLDKLGRYAKRIYIDMQVIGKWQRLFIKLPNRDSFILASIYSLALVCRGLHKLEQDTESKKNLVSEKDFNAFLNHLNKLGRGKNVLYHGVCDRYYNEARELFTSVLGESPPSNLVYERHVMSFFYAQLCFDIGRICAFFTPGSGIERTLTCIEIREVALYLWCRWLMAALSHNDVFVTKPRSYAFDTWGITDWS